MAHLDDMIASHEAAIRTAQEKARGFGDLLLHYRSREWQHIAADLEQAVIAKRLALRDYRGGDWRALGQLQGELTNLEHIMATPTRLMEQIAIAEQQVAHSTTEIQKLTQGTIR